MRPMAAGKENLKEGAKKMDKDLLGALEEQANGVTAAALAVGIPEWGEERKWELVWNCQNEKATRLDSLIRAGGQPKALVEVSIDTNPACIYARDLGVLGSYAAEEELCMDRFLLWVADYVQSRIKTESTPAEVRQHFERCAPSFRPAASDFVTYIHAAEMNSHSRIASDCSVEVLRPGSVLTYRDGPVWEHPGFSLRVPKKPN
jgi:hypothetical protein